MLQTAPFNKYIDKYEAWFEKYNDVFLSEISAIKRQFEKLPEDLHGIEIGMGSGRYALELGIKEGIEPAKYLREMAYDRGLDVIDAHAEHLPYRDQSFDFVLFVTIEHLDNLKLAISEAYRVLKPDASIIIAFIDKDSQLAKKYIQHRSEFYKHAQFYSVKKVEELVIKFGFKNPEFIQTLFKDIDRIKEIEIAKEGYGEGSFVVISATK